MSPFKDILPKTGIMQKVCDAVKENPFRTSNQWEIQGDDDNGRHSFECSALTHGV